MKTTEERLMHLEDDLAIRNLNAKFADMATVADFEGFRTLWKPDGVWTINEPNLYTATGIDDMVAFFKMLRDEKTFFVQFLHSGVINIDGNTATGRWILHEVGEGPGESYYNNYGVYTDTLEKINGSWVFATRSYHYLWLDTGKFAGQPFRLPEYYKHSNEESEDTCIGI